MDPTQDFYSFVKLTDLPPSLSLSIRINSLQGNLQRSSLIDLLESPSKKGWGTNIEPYPPFYLTLRLYSANKPLTPVHRTPFKAFKKAWVWNTTIDFAFPIRELPLDAQVGITIWDSRGLSSDEGEEEKDSPKEDRVIGGTTLRLFGKKGTLKKAQHRCFVHLGVKADGSANSDTGSKGVIGEGAEDGKVGMSEMTRLEKLIKRHERSDLPHLKWLDKQTYRVIESIHAKESENLQNELWLYIDLPRFEWPIVWCEEEISSDISSSLAPHHLHHGGRAMGRSIPGPSGPATNPSTTAALATAASTSQPSPSATNTVNAQGAISRPTERIDRTLFTLPDPESQRENPIEAKHRRLVRAQRSRHRGMGGSTSGLGGVGVGNLTLARNLKPDKKARDEIEGILSSPPTRELTEKESDLLWTYRFYLTKNPRGLTKFLKAVSWNDRVESRLAVDTVLPLWGGGGVTTVVDGTTITTTPVEIGDVLELLGPACKMMDRAVRKWAVDRLAERDDEEISLYLLQLVQALKLDDREEEEESGTNGGAATSHRPSTGASHKSINTGLQIESSSGIKTGSSLGPLTELLIARALSSAHSATPSPATFSLLITFYWYLSVECADDRWGLLYRRIRRRLEKGLDQAGDVGHQYLSIIRRQEKMVSRLGEMARGLRQSKEGRLKKIEKLKDAVKNEKGLGLLESPEEDHHHHHGGGGGGGGGTGSAASGLPLPLDPTILAKHIKPEQCSVFKSNLLPLLIWFETEPMVPAPASHDGTAAAAATSDPIVEDYALIFKSGDDLRQDQLVLQLFQLMDRLLLNENLDLKLTPYRVLATAPKEGMVQFVKSKTLATIVNEHGTLNEYLRSGGGRGTEEEKMDRFVRSCAGYCVVTYLLGVGDRHLDNLLLTPDGRFFHVDFGYILNRDPKPFPPPVKVSKEMVDCMGGPSSPDYSRFRQLCFTAFSILRKNANLILNLVALMQDAPVGDIQVEPDRAVGKILEKFRLDLSESDARVYFDDLLQQSSYLTVVFDRLHDAAQFFRS